MSIHTQVLPLFVAATFGFAGGLVATGWLTRNAVATPDSKVIQAQQLRVVDQRGVTRTIISPGDIYLNDSGGKTRLRLIADRGEGGYIWFYDGKGGVDRLFTATRPGSQARPLASLREPGGKADSARPEDIRFLQSQIDRLRVKMNELVERVNLFSQ